MSSKTRTKQSRSAKPTSKLKKLSTSQKTAKKKKSALSSSQEPSASVNPSRPETAALQAKVERFDLTSQSPKTEVVSLTPPPSDGNVTPGSPMPQIYTPPTKGSGAGSGSTPGSNPTPSESLPSVGPQSGALVSLICVLSAAGLLLALLYGIYRLVKHLA